MWQSCFADGTRGLTAAARCTRLQPASGKHAARLRLKRSFSAPHISHCMGQYSCLHTQSQAGCSVYLRCESHGLPVLSAPVCVYTVRGTPIPSQRESESVTCWAALLPLYLRRESQGLLSAPIYVCTVRGTPIPSQRESESVTGWAALLPLYLRCESHGLGNCVCIHGPKDSEYEPGWAAEPPQMPSYVQSSTPYC